MAEELTFLLTDVESSTALWERDAAQMSAALTLHDALIASAVEARGGSLIRERGEGDSTFAVFGSPIDAVAAAADLTRSLTAAVWPGDVPLRVRVAVYTGPAETRDGDYYGTTVNRAARTRALGFGGQILLGHATATAAAGALPNDTALVDLGPRPLKDLSSPEHVFELRLTDIATLPEPLSDADASSLVWAERSLTAGLVGREAERAALDAAWTRATSGGRVLVVLEGEAGIGKTSLAGDLASRAHDAGAAVLHGRWDEDFLAPYQAFREALSTYAIGCPRSILRADLRDHAPHLVRLLPDVGVRIDADPAAPGSDAEAERLRLFEAFGAWFEAICARRPVLLVLDDIQWADRPSLLLVQHILRSPHPVPMMVLATMRSPEATVGELGPFVEVLGRDVDVRRVRLEGLTKADVIELVGKLSGRRLDDRSVVLAEALHAETGGNPLFLRSMVTHLADIDRLDASAIEGLELPESVRDLVRWRLRPLSDDERGVLAAASVVGEEFDLDVLGATCGMDAETLVDVLAPSRRAGLVHDAGHGGFRYAFSHALVRRALLDDLGGPRRARLHSEVGEILEKRPATTAAELAHHFWSAIAQGGADRAIHYARIAGDEAMAQLAFESAVQQLQRALEMQTALRPEQDVLRCQILLELANAHDRAGAYAERDARALDAATTARGAGRADLFAAAAMAFGGSLSAATEPHPMGQALLEEALELLDPGDSRERAGVMGRLAHRLALVPPRQRRLDLADQAVAMARRLGDPADLAAVLMHRCWALNGPDDLEDQVALAAEVRALGEQVGDREIVLRSLHCRTDALLEADDTLALRASVDEMRDLAHELRYPEYLRITRAWDAVFAGIEGRHDEALAIADEVRAVLLAMGHPDAELVPAGLRFPIRWLRGEIIEGLALYEALAAEFPSPVFWQMIVAWCQAEAGMTEPARAALDGIRYESIAELDRSFTWWSAIVGMASTATLLGDGPWAALLYDLVLPYRDRACSAGSSSFLGCAHHHLGALAATLERWDDAEQHFEAALERHAAMGAVPFLALTRQSYARMLLDRGRPDDRDRADLMQDEAGRVAAAMGLRAVERRASVPER